MPPTCTRPLYDMLINRTFDWLVCSHSLNAGGPLVVGALLHVSVFTILLNWTESAYPPLVWTALASGVLFNFVPGSIAMRLVSLLTVIVASTLVLLWQAWRR